MADEIDVDVRKVGDAFDEFAEAFKTAVKVEGTIEILWPAQFHNTLRDQSLRPLPIKGTHVILPQQRRVDVVSVEAVVGEYRVAIACHRVRISSAKIGIFRDFLAMRQLGSDFFVSLQSQTFDFVVKYGCNTKERTFVSPSLEEQI